jgi:hypothetical protein
VLVQGLAMAQGLALAGSCVASGVTLGFEELV